MRIDDHVLFGEKAGKMRASILQGLREGKVQPQVYVVTLPLSGNNLLEIYPSIELLFPPFDKEDLLITGIAVTYYEALELVRTMIDERYQQGELC